MTPGGRLLILGLGNVLCGDDGLGVIAVRMLSERYSMAPGVELCAGGMQGLSLLPLFEKAERAILVDAVHAGTAAGSLVRIEAPQLGDLLAGVRLLERRPERIVLLGLVPRTLDVQLGCSPEIEAALPDLVDAIAEEAARLGFPLRPPALPATAHATSALCAARILGLEGVGCP